MRKLLYLSLGLVLAVIAADFLFPQQMVRAGLAVERGLAGLEPHRFDSPLGEIAYLRGGTGETLVLIHGFGADKDNFTRTARHLTAHFDVLAPDLPGFGDSVRLLDADYHIDAQVERLHDILGALGVERFWLGGSSMGGNIALAYAARYPQQVAGLWLLAPAGVGGAILSESLEYHARTGGSLLVADTVERWAEIPRFTMVDPPFLPRAYRQVLGARAVRDHALHSRIFDELHDSPPINEAVRGLPVPALIIWGEEDRALHVSGAAVLGNLLPRAELRIWPDIGHLPMVERPRAAAAAWLDFVARQRAQ